MRSIEHGGTFSASGPRVSSVGWCFAECSVVLTSRKFEIARERVVNRRSKSGYEKGHVSGTSPIQALVDLNTRPEIHEFSVTPSTDNATCYYVHFLLHHELHRWEKFSGAAIDIVHSKRSTICTFMSPLRRCAHAL
jgi:hypothetical protein